MLLSEAIASILLEEGALPSSPPRCVAATTAWYWARLRLLKQIATVIESRASSEAPDLQELGADLRTGLLGYAASDTWTMAEAECIELHREPGEHSLVEYRVAGTKTTVSELLELLELVPWNHICAGLPTEKLAQLTLFTDERWRSTLRFVTLLVILLEG